MTAKNQPMPPPTKFKRLLRRLAQASREEILFRGRQQLWNRCQALRYRAGLGLATEKGWLVELSPPLQVGRFLFSPAELPGLVSTLRNRLPQAAEEAITRAERICAHNFDLLGYRDLDLRPHINWHLDPVHKKQAPLKIFYNVPYLDFEIVGDSKITWELNRHQHFITLGKAYQLTKNEKFAQEFVRQFYDWQEQNPYLMGINWASSLEVAFRSLSWLWARELFAGSRSFPAQVERDLLLALGRSARFIEHNLSVHFSRNTHLLGEAVALFFIGVMCPKLKRASVWQALGWKTILREAQYQIHPDGGYFEQATYYHVYALDMLLHARVLAGRNQLPIPESLDRTLELMLDYLATLSTAGPTLRIGDDDGGRLFDSRRNRTEHLTDPLSTGAVLFRRGNFKTASTALSEETLWLLGPSAAAEFDALPVAQPLQASRAFPSSGIYCMATNGLRLTMDAGPFGTRLCGHAHADALSITVAADGREWLADPGTFTYTASARWREIFRGTAAHNTLMIDGQNQAEPKAPFEWEKIPDVRVEHWWAGESFDLLIASHTGYMRLGSPAMHRRLVFFVKPRFWLVIDTVLGVGEHQLELYWHAPGGPAVLGANALELGSPEDARLGIVPASDPAWSRELFDGWHSACYGDRQSVPALRCSARTVLPAEFATLLIPRLVKTSGRLERLGSPLSGFGPRGFQYGTDSEQHSWILADGGGAWRLGDFESDASLVYYCAQNPPGDPQRVVLCEGSFLSVKGVRVVDLPGRHSHFEQSWPDERGMTRDETRAEADAFVVNQSNRVH